MLYPLILDCADKIDVIFLNQGFPVIGCNNGGSILIGVGNIGATVYTISAEEKRCVFDDN